MYLVVYNDTFFIFFHRSMQDTLSCYFTKKRPSKIFKIEKINRQTLDKNVLILTNKSSLKVITLT